MLNLAKNSHPEAKLAKPAKKSKRRIDDKPTLIICKRNGEYVVEMKNDALDKNTACNPLVFEIASADNEDKIRARARKKRRLINRAVDEVWTDPYNPDACRDVCYKVYKQAIGLDPFGPYDPECNCLEQELETESCSCGTLESDCSSLDVDWEIHFSPPSAFFQKDKEQEPEQNVIPSDDGSKGQIVTLRNPNGLKNGAKKSISLI